MVNKNVLSCLLKDGKEVNAVMLVGRLFHARATVTRNDRSPIVLSHGPDILHMHPHTTLPVKIFKHCDSLNMKSSVADGVEPGSRNDQAWTGTGP